jgi:hypothetical protein
MASTAAVAVVLAVLVVLVAAPWLDEDESQDWLGRRREQTYGIREIRRKLVSSIFGKYINSFLD